ncbi:hypothetical protein KEM55_007935, partial [Ascosphaera atra]
FCICRSYMSQHSPNPCGSPELRSRVPGSVLPSGAQPPPWATNHSACCRPVPWLGCAKWEAPVGSWDLRARVWERKYWPSMVWLPSVAWIVVAMTFGLAVVLLLSPLRFSTGHVGTWD